MGPREQADAHHVGIFVLDGGVPVQQGTYSVGFAGLVPTAAMTATPQSPVPVIVFGHGLLGDAIDYSTNPVLQDAAERNGMLMVTPSASNFFSVAARSFTSKPM